MTAVSVFVALALLAPLLAVALPKAMAPLAAIAILAIGVVQWRNRRLPDMPWPPVLIFGALVMWGLITLLWSLEPARGLATAGKLAFLLFGALLLSGAARSLDAQDRRRIGVALCVGTFLALAVLGEENWTDGAMLGLIRKQFGQPRFEAYTLNAGTTVLVVLLWPALMALRGIAKPALWAAGFAAAVAVLATTESATATVAVLAGLAVALWGLAGRGTVLLRRGVVVLLVLATLGAPALALGKYLFGEREIANPTVSSVMHRLYIWDFVAARVREKPILGWGLESSKAIPGGHTGPVEGRGSFREQMVRSYKTMLLPLHPHNAGLQVWVELGLPGILLFAGLLAWLVRAIGRSGLPAATAGLCLAQLVSVFCIAEVAYGIWQSWWLSAIVIGTAFTMALAPASSETPKKSLG